MQPVDAERRLQGWLAEATGRSDIVLGQVLAGGNSNVTRLIETREGRLVLRHPPVNVISDRAIAQWSPTHQGARRPRSGPQSHCMVC